MADAREDAAAETAAALVTCVINDDLPTAIRLVRANDHLHEDMLIILAGLAAEDLTAEAWQQRLIDIAEATP